MSSPRVSALLAAVAATLAATAIWLTFDNPDIDGTSRGDGYTCLAPWDTVRNNATNHPGGEPPPDSEEIAARCRDAGHDRFGLAVAGGSSAVVLAALATALAWGRSRPGVRASATDRRAAG
jgi:hypothetical protein